MSSGSEQQLEYTRASVGRTVMNTTDTTPIQAASSFGGSLRIMQAAMRMSRRPHCPSNTIHGRSYSDPDVFRSTSTPLLPRPSTLPYPANFSDPDTPLPSRMTLSIAPRLAMTLPYVPRAVQSASTTSSSDFSPRWGSTFSKTWSPFPTSIMSRPRASASLPLPGEDSGTSEARSQVEGSRQRFKRSRTGCLMCRKRKVKCDETLPVCMRCQRNKLGLQCEYPDTNSKKKRSDQGQSNRRHHTSSEADHSAEDDNSSAHVGYVLRDGARSRSAIGIADLTKNPINLGSSTHGPQTPAPANQDLQAAFASAFTSPHFDFLRSNTYESSKDPQSHLHEHIASRWAEIDGQGLKERLLSRRDYAAQKARVDREGALYNDPQYLMREFEPAALYQHFNPVLEYRDIAFLNLEAFIGYYFTNAQEQELVLFEIAYAIRGLLCVDCRTENNAWEQVHPDFSFSNDLTLSLEPLERNSSHRAMCLGLAAAGSAHTAFKNGKDTRYKQLAAHLRRSAIEQLQLAVTQSEADQNMFLAALFATMLRDMIAGDSAWKSILSIIENTITRRGGPSEILALNQSTPQNEPAKRTTRFLLDQIVYRDVFNSLSTGDPSTLMGLGERWFDVQTDRFTTAKPWSQGSFEDTYLCDRITVIRMDRLAKLMAYCNAFNVRLDISTRPQRSGKQIVSSAETDPLNDLSLDRPIGADEMPEIHNRVRDEAFRLLDEIEDALSQNEHKIVVMLSQTALLCIWRIAFRLSETDPKLKHVVKQIIEGLEELFIAHDHACFGLPMIVAGSFAYNDEQVKQLEHLFDVAAARYGWLVFPVQIILQEVWRRNREKRTDDEHSDWLTVMNYLRHTSANQSTSQLLTESNTPADPLQGMLDVMQ